MWIFDTLNAQAHSTYFSLRFTATTEGRSVNRAQFIATEFHGFLRKPWDVIAA